MGFLADWLGISKQNLGTTFRWVRHGRRATFNRFFDQISLCRLSFLLPTTPFYTSIFTYNPVLSNSSSIILGTLASSHVLSVNASSLRPQRNYLGLFQSRSRSHKEPHHSSGSGARAEATKINRLHTPAFNARAKSSRIITA